MKAKIPAIAVILPAAPAAVAPTLEGKEDDAEAVAEAVDDERSIVPVDDDGDELALRFGCCCCCCWLEDDDDSVVAVARSREERGRALPYRGIREGRERRGRRGGGKNREHRPDEDVEADRELARLLAAAAAAAAAEAVENEEQSNIVVLLLFWNLLLLLRVLEAAARTDRIEKEQE